LTNAARKHQFPVIRFGRLTVVDRRAYEDVGEIQAAMKDYLGRFRTINRPLCLAVFGAPGGGKSFAVKELSASLQSDMLDGDALEVNVSQYARPEELAWVFQVVRDTALQGKVKLVFFDEFDAALNDRTFGWQQTFLAPMQDGKFGSAPNEVVFRHGIFVFVGGVNHSFDMFLGRSRDRQFIEAKGPDFMSRLVRNLNVFGLTREGPDDLAAVVRRAVIIRHTLYSSHPGIFWQTPPVSVVDPDAKPAPRREKDEDAYAHIDDDVATALLTVERFRHGLRSLEAIIRTSRLGADHPRFHWGGLPSPSQLDMHVDVAKLTAARDGRFGARS
jgi:hypothetical protein